MANLNQPPSRVTPNLLHILNAFTDSSNSIVNAIVELNSNTINKYELITETGHLKLDRVVILHLLIPLPMDVYQGLGMKMEIHLMWKLLE